MALRLLERAPTVKYALRAGVLCIAFFAASMTAHALDVSQLMGWLAQAREGSATFVEERIVNGFDAPLVASGELYFKAPDVFERRTLKPSRESMSVRGNNVTLARGNLKRSTTLDAAPEAAAIVSAIRGTLTGDGKSLAEHYRVALSGEAERWLLDLTPRDEQLAANVRIVQLRGNQGVVQSVEVWFANGDRSVMKITPKPPSTSRP